MRSRYDILTDLVNLSGDITILKKELSEYPWDIEEPILIISKVAFIEVLQRGIDGETSNEAIEDWADTIECRDDLEYEANKMEAIVFELVNPAINRKIPNGLLQEFINELSAQN